MRLGAGQDESAAPELLGCQRCVHLGEDAEDPISRVVVGGKNACHAHLAVLEVLLEVSANELVLAPEDAVKGRLRHPGTLDDAVDPHDVHALRIEELVGGREQALTRRPLDLGSHDQTLT